VSDNASTDLGSYEYELPDDRIAKRPLAERAASRLLHLPADGGPTHRMFRDLPALLQEGDTLVVNDTRVFPARLYGEKAETGGRCEVLLSRRDPDGAWIALVSASKRVKPGGRLVFGGVPGGFDEPFFARVEEAVEDEPGAFRLRFEGDVLAYAEMFGHVPLPPYLERDDDDDDKDRYQTVYADKDHTGAVAAPTAGFHFDDEMLATLKEQGVELVKVTLHVGPGTFLPVREQDVRKHQMHAEPWEVSRAAAAALNATRERGGRVIAVGTTCVRALEACLEGGAPDARFAAGSGLTRLFIRPGYRFRAIDALLTNFHLPGSTLLMLVAAVVGRERVLAAYEEAVREGYRFFSYGDSSLLEVVQEARA
jgi:S-adenosylmethionine:tRNA ribosyltransferase-isomerase